MNEREIKELCDSWLMSIIEVSGGIRHIPENEKKSISELMKLCEDEFRENYEKDSSEESIKNFWIKWKEKHPEFYDFQKYSKYNDNPEMAEKALSKAKKRFE